MRMTKRTKIISRMQRLAVAISVDAQNSLAEMLVGLADLEPQPIVIVAWCDGLQILSSQFVHKGHLWLGFLTINKRGRTEFRCWVSELSKPELVGRYIENDDFTTSGEALETGGFDNTHLFGIDRECKSQMNGGITREAAGLDAISLFSLEVLSGKVTLDHMIRSFEFTRVHVSALVERGGLSGLG